MRLRLLLPVELRPGLDVDPDADLVDDGGDVLAALPDRCRDILVVDVDHGLCIADHLDVDEALGVPPDLPLDLLLHEFPAGAFVALLLRGSRSGLAAGCPHGLAGMTGWLMFWTWAPWRLACGGCRPGRLLP